MKWLLWTAAGTQPSAASLDAFRSAWPDAAVLWPQPGDTLRLAGATLHVSQAAGQGGPAQQFLLAEEHMLFTGCAAAPAAHATGEAEWIAPASGFIFRAPR
ncbi:hypothetical protein D9M68_878000 [compost metagenome]